MTVSTIPSILPLIPNYPGSPTASVLAPNASFTSKYFYDLALGIAWSLFLSLIRSLLE